MKSFNILFDPPLLEGIPNEHEHEHKQYPRLSAGTMSDKNHLFGIINMANLPIIDPMKQSPKAATLGMRSSIKSLATSKLGANVRAMNQLGNRGNRKILSPMRPMKKPLIADNTNNINP